MKQKKLLVIVLIVVTVLCTMRHYLAVQSVIVMNTTRWQKFKTFILALCAVLAGAGFIEQLAKIRKIKRNARRPIKLDKMMLSHHDDCVFWDTNHKKCDCFMSWVYKDLKELQKYRERSKKQEIW